MYSPSNNIADIPVNTDNRPSSHDGSVNLRNHEGQVGDSRNITETENGALGPPLELVPPVPQAPMNCSSRGEIVNETPDLVDQVAIQCWTSGRAAAETWEIATSFCSNMIARTVYTATSFCGPTVTGG